MGLGAMVLADLAALVGPGSVEVTQADVPDSERDLEIHERPLESELRPSIGIDGVLRMVFRDRSAGPARRR